MYEPTDENIFYNLLDIYILGLPNITVGHKTDINNRSIKLRGVVFLSKNSPDIQNVFWSKNGEKIDVQGSGGRLSGVTIDDPSLTIRDVSQEDAGKYQLTAINAVGPNDSDVISIGMLKVLFFLICLCCFMTFLEEAEDKALLFIQLYVNCVVTKRFLIG